MADRSRKTRLLRISFVIAVQIAATFLLFEVALRLIRPHHAGLGNLLYLPSVSTDLSRIDKLPDLLETTSKGLKPGRTSHGFVLNSRGLRTHEYEDERGGGLRIVAIGDSFTWGVVPHRYSWPVRLQTMLRKTLNRQDVEVISLGVPGAGPMFYLRMWELAGRRLQPDLVVLGFFIGNDLTDNIGIRPEEARYGWLVEHSLAVRSIRNLARVLTSGMQNDEEEILRTKGRRATPGRLGYELPGVAESFDPSQRAMKEKTFMRIEWNRMAVCLESNRPMVRRLVRRVRPILEELDRSVKGAGAELVVFLIPDEFQVNDELSARLLEMNDTATTEFSRNFPQKKLVTSCLEAGIYHIDPLQRFRSRNKTQNLYLPRNTHWNEAGNRLAAQMMVDYLQVSDLLPDTEGEK